MSDWSTYGEYENIELLRNGSAARIVLNRPHALNAWDSGIGSDLKDAIAKVEVDPAIRAVELRGAGRAFSSGADLKEGFADLDEQGAPNLEKALHDRYHPVILGIRRMPKPVIASVHGPAVGVSCALALACDLVFASESAYFLLSFASIGLVPDGGSSAFIPARTGFSRASEMALLAERISGTKAAEWGLVNRLFTDAEFEAATEALVLKLSRGATSAYAGAKAQLNASCFPELEAQLGLEASLQQGQAASADFREGVTAFLEGRDARFGEE